VLPTEAKRLKLPTAISALARGHLFGEQDRLEVAGDRPPDVPALGRGQLHRAGARARR